MSENLQVIEQDDYDPVPDNGHIDTNPDAVIELVQAKGLALLTGNTPYDNTTIGLMRQLTSTALGQKRTVVEQSKADAQGEVAATLAQMVMGMGDKNPFKDSTPNGATRTFEIPADTEEFEISEAELSTDNITTDYDEILALRETGELE